MNKMRIDGLLGVCKSEVGPMEIAGISATAWKTQTGHLGQYGMHVKHANSLTRFLELGRLWRSRTDDADDRCTPRVQVEVATRKRSHEINGVSASSNRHQTPSSTSSAMLTTRQHPRWRWMSRQHSYISTSEKAYNPP